MMSVGARPLVLKGAQLHMKKNKSSPKEGIKCASINIRGTSLGWFTSYLSADSC